jgi:hypothetical protein
MRSADWSATARVWETSQCLPILGPHEACSGAS